MTLEGGQTWDVLTRCGGQLRGIGLGGVAGIDLGAALRLAEALDYDTHAVALLLSQVEAGAVTAMRAAAEPDTEGGRDRPH